MNIIPHSDSVYYDASEARRSRSPKCNRVDYSQDNGISLPDSGIMNRSRSLGDFSYRFWERRGDSNFLEIA